MIKIMMIITMIIKEGFSQVTYVHTFDRKFFILKMPMIKIILLGIGFEERKQYN